LYVRVSTNNRATGNQAIFEQNPDVQELPLRQLAEQRGWSVIQVYSDRMSGSKADRPGLKALMQDARRCAFDVVLVWRFDRFARSIEQLVLALAEFRTLGIDFVSAQEALARYQHADGQGHVHHRGGEGGTRAQCHPRANPRRSGARPGPRDQERSQNRQAGCGTRPRAPGGAAERGKVKAGDCYDLRRGYCYPAPGIPGGRSETYLKPARIR
jgi:hypothetical protein